MARDQSVSLRSGAPHGEVWRSALLARLQRSRPRIVCLVAPAGYGKSTLARQLTDGVAVSLCDCLAVRDTSTLGRRVIASLADASPERLSFLVQSEVQTSLGEVAAVDLTHQAWRQPCERSTFVFENAEELIAVDGAVTLVSKLLTSLPPERSVVICTRQRLPVQLSRFVAPHEVLVLDAEDLRFGYDEFRQVLGQSELAEETLRKAFELSRGWPIVAALFARFMREGKLGELLSRLDDVAFDELIATSPTKRLVRSRKRCSMR